MDKTTTRKLMQAIAGLGPAVCLLKLAADQVRALSGWVTWLGAVCSPAGLLACLLPRHAHACVFTHIVVPFATPLACQQGQGSVGSLPEAAALVTAWVSLCGFSAAGYGSNHQDISRQYSGILYGLSNGLASVAASGELCSRCLAARACACLAPGWLCQPVPPCMAV